MRSLLLSVCALAFCAVSAWAAAEITADGERLAAKLDGMRVEQHWLAGGVVEWRTGNPKSSDSASADKHTHCSQFVAAACERLGIYILRPPEHSAVLLANGQFDWLQNEGRAAGWQPVADGVEAQDRANRGEVVVATCRNDDPAKPGHIAIVRPGRKTPEQIAAEGPDVIQAGQTNYNSTSLKRGFSNHPQAFSKGEIRFYGHAPEAAK